MVLNKELKLHRHYAFYSHRCVTCPARRARQKLAHHLDDHFQNLFRLSLPFLFSAPASSGFCLSGDAVSEAPADLLTFLSRVKDRNANSLDLEVATSRFTLAPACIPPRPSALCVSGPSESCTGGGGGVVVQPSGFAVSTSGSVSAGACACSVRGAGAASRSGVSVGVAGHEAFVPGVGFVTLACVTVPPATSVSAVSASPFACSS